MSAADHLSNQFGAHENVEYVPTSALDPMRVSDRAHERPGMIYTGPDRIKELQGSIKESGIKEPLIVQYSQHHRSAQLAEGHHRLEAAKNLGITHVPVRVERVIGKHTGEPYSPVKGPQYVSGVEPDFSGYVRADLKPSEIGLPIKDSK